MQCTCDRPGTEMLFLVLSFVDSMHYFVPAMVANIVGGMSFYLGSSLICKKGTTRGQPGHVDRLGVGHPWRVRMSERSRAQAYLASHHGRYTLESQQGHLPLERDPFNCRDCTSHDHDAPSNGRFKP